MAKNHNTSFLDKEIINAIYQIAGRSDQIIDDEKILHSFYDDNVIKKLDNINNQIIQGRRGTGKTHLLRVLSCTLASESTHPIYIDCRLLGSASSIVSNNNADIVSRSMHLFRDFIYKISGDLNNFFSWNNYNYDSEDTYTCIRQYLDEFVSCSQNRETSLETTQETEQTLLNHSDNEKSITFDTTPSIGFFRNKKSSSEFGGKIKYSEKKKSSETIIFPNISQSLDEITRKTGVRIYLLIDEWVSIPPDIQPIFAEFLKRCFLCCPFITVKIAIVPNRAKFLEKTETETFGLEIGTEITSAVDLDQMLIFDKFPKRVIRFMGELLVKHINVLLPHRHIKIEDLSDGFESSAAFIQIIKASEGNARDFFNIMAKSLSVFDFLDLPMDTVTIRSPDVLRAAQSWFNLDKYSTLSEKQQKQFDALLSYVVSDHSTRGGFISEKALANPFMLDLIDARVVHVISQGHLNRLLGRGRFALITLDYGSYSDQLLQGKCLDLFLDDPMEKICRAHECEKSDNRYWPYDTRSVVACFIDFFEDELLKPLFF